MFNLEKNHIKKALPKIEKGLNQYLWIQKEVNKRNVSKDREFQKKFNAFYRVRRSPKWQEEFYKLLEANKKRKVSFEDILIKLYEKTGRMESSFASKLVATINPEMPIIDKIVFRNLGLKLPYTNIKNRNSIVGGLYRALIKEFIQFIQTENGKYLVRQFIKEHPEAKITKTKMLDFVLWQTRK